jgi:hypothetical protein
MPELSDTERRMLDLEDTTWRYPGAKDAVIRERFGISATRYYARLSVLLRRPEALAYAPTTANRLRRLEERRRAARRGR